MLNLFKNNSYWITSGFHTLLERFGSLFINLFTFILLIRILDKESYGIWVLYFSLLVSFDLVRKGLVRSPFLKYLHDTDQQVNRDVHFSSFIINFFYTIFLSIVVLILFFVFRERLDFAQIHILLFGFFFHNFLYLIFSHSEYILFSNQVFHKIMYSNLLFRLLFLLSILSYVVVGISLDITYLVVFHISCLLISTIFISIVTRKHFLFAAKLNRRKMMELIGYGKFTLGSNLASILMRNIDAWMLLILINPVAVAIYNPAVRIANLFEVPTVALTNIIFPEAVKRIRKKGKKEAKMLYEKSTAYLFALLLPVVILFIVFAKPVILLIAGERYLESVNILRVTMCYGLLLPFLREFGIILDSMGKAKLNMLITSRNVVVNIILNFIFINYYGVIGAAYATLSTYLVSWIINQFYLKSILDSRVSDYLVQIKSFYVNFIPSTIHSFFYRK